MTSGPIPSPGSMSSFLLAGMATYSSRMKVFASFYRKKRLLFVCAAAPPTPR
jgi:hypothetical protein